MFVTCSSSSMMVMLPTSCHARAMALAFLEFEHDGNVSRKAINWSWGTVVQEQILEGQAEHYKAVQNIGKHGKHLDSRSNTDRNLHPHYLTLEFFSSGAGGNCWDKTDRAVLFAVLLRFNFAAIRMPFSTSFGLVTSAKRKALARPSNHEEDTLEITLEITRNIYIRGMPSLSLGKEAALKDDVCHLIAGMWPATGIQEAAPTFYCVSYSESLIWLVIGHVVLGTALQCR